MPREEKKKEVAQLVDVFSSSKGIYLTDFTGLNVELLTSLRRKLRECSVSYRVVKNTLAARAAKQAGLNELTEFLKGPTAIAYTNGDPVTPAKVISEFLEEDGRSRFKSASIEGQIYTAEQVASLATLPSEEELLSKVVWGVSAPLSGLVISLQAILQTLVTTLDAIAKQREKEVQAQ
ncbi:MAG: 50S ribosomal protein L10 [Candidatus Latescibacteria bacterium 4484_181]|nr:MAG: 50S ribosomal protein L10 [Candidatus Latescibacteria bacterium 4484_181]RKY69281.1 MAG: 50S ribosomal protein L10 [Candidatus Latescibacterota bacterium]RKY73206.1 MAG: 50S ribosomal protein L10 [Candidatus Latescibacterota bacterium]